MTVAFTLTMLWFAVMVLVVVACRMAAKGDRAMQSDRLAQLSDELSASGEPPVTVPEFKAYRIGDRAGLQPTAPEHVRHRSQ